MSAAATIPFTADRSVSHSPPPPLAPSLNPEPRTLTPPWSPTDRDRLIFQWVKFDGEKQSIVATRLGMHQTTVSRIVDRYERWIAHGGPSQQGGLSRDERIRAQRWLTYERNEWILNSALRIAGEMEIPADASRSTIKQAPQDPTKELEVRTQHFVLHRAGLAARFLRLAHRINMDQQKIVERDPLPDLEPLSHQDLAPEDEHLPAVCHGHPARADRADDLTSVDVVAGSPDPATTSTAGLPADYHDQSDDAEPPMHPTHTNAESKSPLTNSPITTYDQNHRTQKTQTPAYPVASSPPESTDPARSMAFTPPPKMATCR